jgi:hypothetical protein
MRPSVLPLPMKLAPQPFRRGAPAKRNLPPFRFTSSTPIKCTPASLRSRCCVCASNSRPLFSYSYELLFSQVLCFDNHPHYPGGVGHCTVLLLPVRGRSRKALPFKSLQPLASLFPTPGLWFQSFAASFSKTPGVWGATVRHRIARPSHNKDPVTGAFPLIPTDSCRLTADSVAAGTHRLGAIGSVNAHVLRREIAGPVTGARVAGVQVHHDGHMVR